MHETWGRPARQGAQSISKRNGEEFVSILGGRRIVRLSQSLPKMSLLSSLSLFRRAAPLIQHSVPAASRARGDLAPRRTKYKKSHKGRVPLPTGGSTKGTSLAFGDFGVRVAGDVSARITAKQLKSADAALRKKLKVIKGTSVWLRVFPDIPVCVKVSTKHQPLALQKF